MEVRIRRGTSSQLSSANPVLADGEPCLEIDTGKVKYGDGVTPWSLLDYASSNDVSFGTNNEATGSDAFAGGGEDNLASGASALVLGGRSNSASGSKSSSLAGESNDPVGQRSVAVGGSGVVCAEPSSVVLGGQENVADAACSVALGRNARALRDSQVSFSSGRFEANGDAEYSIQTLKATTQGAVPARMLVAGVDDLVLPPGSSWMFKIRVVASSESGFVGSWSFEGGVGRDFSNNTALSGTPESHSWLGSESGYEVSVDADDISEALAITVSGPGGSSVRWVATVSILEVISDEPLVSDMFVELNADAQITSLSVGGGSGAMQPGFDPSITDYVVYSNSGFQSSSASSYSVVINGGPETQVSASVNQAIRVKHGMQDYFVRILPSDFPPLLEIQTKTQDYIPGYYLLSFEENPYFAVYDGNGVPVWYTYADESLCGMFGLNPGWEPNRLMTQGITNNCPRWDVGIALNELTAKPYTMINPDTRGDSHTWELHESHAISGPESRKGNIIYQSYDTTGFYIQEQDPQGQIVWEWWSDDYFDTTYANYFHLNSINVHPVTGDVLLSCRHSASVLSIDYETKDIIWVLEGDGNCLSGSLFSVRKQNMTANTKWLAPYGEPTLPGFSQYNGTSDQHDARWNMDFQPLVPGNDIVTVFDNQQCMARQARGVVYEIDLENNRGVFRSHVYSSNGNSPQRGGFTLLKEMDGSFSHVCCFPGQNPNLVEFKGDANGVGTQTVTLSAFTGFILHYRCVKVRSDFFDINYLRTTAGRVPTLV